MVPKFKVGDRVFDRPSQTEVTILAITVDDVGVYYETDAAPDPTGDGAFPKGDRCDFEVCAIDDIKTREAPFEY